LSFIRNDGDSAVADHDKSDKGEGRSSPLLKGSDDQPCALILEGIENKG